MSLDYRVTDDDALDDFLRLPAVEKYFGHPQVNVRLVDRTGAYLFVGSSVRSILGYDPAEYIAENAASRCHPDDQHILGELGAPLASGKSVETVLRGLCKDGSYAWIHTRLAPFREYVAVLVQRTDAPKGGAYWKPSVSFLEAEG